MLSDPAVLNVRVRVSVSVVAGCGVTGAWEVSCPAFSPKKSLHLELPLQEAYTWYGWTAGPVIFGRLQNEGWRYPTRRGNECCRHRWHQDYAHTICRQLVVVLNALWPFGIYVVCDATRLEGQNEWLPMREDATSWQTVVISTFFIFPTPTTSSPCYRYALSMP